MELSDLDSNKYTKMFGGYRTYVSHRKKKILDNGQAIFLNL